MYQVPGDGLCMLHAFLCAILDGDYISILDKPVYKDQISESVHKNWNEKARFNFIKSFI